jgi:hypothetical protein
MAGATRPSPIQHPESPHDQVRRAPHRLWTANSGKRQDIFIKKPFDKLTPSTRIKPLRAHNRLPDPARLSQSATHAERQGRADSSDCRRCRFSIIYVDTPAWCMDSKPGRVAPLKNKTGPSQSAKAVPLLHTSCGKRATAFLLRRYDILHARKERSC